MAIYFSKPLEDGSRYIFMTGTLSREPKCSYTKAKNAPKVEFGVAYDNKQFMNVLCLGDSAATRTASCLERGDGVFIAGKWTSRTYTSRDGEEKTWTEVKADFVAVQADVSVPTPENGPVGGDPGGPDTGAFTEEDDYGELPF